MLAQWASPQAAALKVPAPIFVSDFKNGIYTLSGASHTYAEVWDPYWTGVDENYIVPGVGLTIDNTQVATAQVGPATTALVNAAIGIPGDYTALIEFSITSADIAQTVPGAALDYVLDATWANGAEMYCNTHGILNEWAINDLQPGMPYKATAPCPLGSHKIALLVSQAAFAGSIDGGAVFSPPGSPQDISVCDTLTPSVYVLGSGATACRATMTKFSIYPKVSPVALQKLSA